MWCMCNDNTFWPAILSKLTYPISNPIEVYHRGIYGNSDEQELPLQSDHTSGNMMLKGMMLYLTNV